MSQAHTLLLRTRLLLSLFCGINFSPNLCRVFPVFARGPCGCVPCSHRRGVPFLISMQCSRCPACALSHATTHRPHHAVLPHAQPSSRTCWASSCELSCRGQLFFVGVCLFLGKRFSYRTIAFFVVRLKQDQADKASSQLLSVHQMVSFMFRPALVGVLT